jgi:hypothetical protein
MDPILAKEWLMIFEVLEIKWPASYAVLKRCKLIGLSRSGKQPSVGLPVDRNSTPSRDSDKVWGSCGVIP